MHEMHEMRQIDSGLGATIRQFAALDKAAPSRAAPQDDETALNILGHEAEIPESAARRAVEVTARKLDPEKKGVDSNDALTTQEGHLRESRDGNPSRLVCARPRPWLD